MRNPFGDDAISRPHKRPRQNDWQRPTDAGVGTEQTIDAFLGTTFANPDSAQNSMIFPPGASEFWGSPVHGLMLSDNLNGYFTSSVVNTPNQVNAHINNESEVAHIATSQSNASSGETISSQAPEDSRDDAIPSPSEGVVAAQDQVAQVDDNALGDTHAQRLSRINLDLVTLLGRIDQGSPRISLDTLMRPPEGSDNFSLTPIYDVLNSTRDYIEVLSTLSGKNDVSAITLSPSATRPGRSGPNANTNSNRRVSGVRGRSSLLSPEYNHATANPPLVLATGCEPKPNLDAATLLQVLTSYIYIAQLYLIIFAHAYEDLLELSGTDEPYLCPVPGVGFSDFPLQSGNLQATMFIQVVNNLFERMESLLGIPRQFQIGIRGTDTAGLLSEEELTGIFKMMALKEEVVRQPDRGKGGISALRQYIDRTKRLLRENIAP